MPTNKLQFTHPGEILDKEFLKPMEIFAYRLAKDIGVPQAWISKIIKDPRMLFRIYSIHRSLRVLSSLSILSLAAY